MTQNIQPIGPSGSGNVPHSFKAKIVDPKVKQQGLENDLFTLSYQHHSRDGKFSLTQCFKNVGQGIWDGIKGIGKALTTPVGFLTAAAVVGLSIAFPPLGVAIGAGFMLFGAAKIVGSTAGIISEYSKGNKDAAEAKANGVGEGLLEVGMGYLGVKGGIKAMKAKGMNPKTYFTDGAKNMYNSGKAKVISTSDYIKGRLGWKAPQADIAPATTGSNLPAIRQVTTTDLATTSGRANGTTGTGTPTSPQPNPNLKALPQPEGTATKATTGTTNNAASTSGTKAGTSAKTTKTAGQIEGPAQNTKAITEAPPKATVNTAMQDALKDIQRIDGAKEVTFFERANGRSIKHTVKNPYDVLGVDRNATPAQLKTAYRKLATQFHPDKAQGLDGSYIRDVNLSYEILTDASKKSALNFELK